MKEVKNSFGLLLLLLYKVKEVKNLQNVLVGVHRKPLMEVASGLHHCTIMRAEFEFQPRGLIGELSVWRYGF